MLIQRLRVSGLLSFGLRGIDLPLTSLNVLIGPNGSGKSNLLEILALLRAAPTKLASPMMTMGGVREWLWKGPGSRREGLVEVTVGGPEAGPLIQHNLVITEHGGRFVVVDEQIGKRQPQDALEGIKIEYFFQRGNPMLFDVDAQIRHLRPESIKPEESILSQIRDPERYPMLRLLQESYPRMELFRSWAFGPLTDIRRPQSTHDRGDFLADGGQNLPLVLSQLTSAVKSEFLASLRYLYEGIEDYRLAISGGDVLLYLREQGGREIPATRLSDGTLRYLGLLAILLHPHLPPLIAIEEPELGLHPDVIPHIAELMIAASQRTQLVVTTHSRMLVDALSEHPGSVIVCEKVNGESQFERLEPDRLALWLEKYSLGELWSMGELGGNRW